jgi:GNAT superfamily N-acetyltransferase
VGIGSYAPADEDMAEVAFVVREDMQGLGIASILLEKLESIAQENDYTGFVATVLRENQAMIQVFKKRYPGAGITMGGGGEVSIVMNFAENEAIRAKKPPVEALSKDLKVCLGSDE